MISLDPSGISLNCFLMGSGTGSNLRYLLENQSSFRICAGFVDRICLFQKICEDYEVPCFYLDGKSYCGDRPIISSGKEFDRYVKKVHKFEEEIIEYIQQFERLSGDQIDLIVLAGYFRVLRGPFLEKYHGRIVNVHPGDLRRKGRDGKRLFTGLNAVLKAIIAGCKETFSTVHYVNEEIDGGSILLLSDPLQIEIEDSLEAFLCDYRLSRGLSLELLSRGELFRMIKEIREDHPIQYARLDALAARHQNLQKERCDWPTYARAIEKYQSILQGPQEITQNHMGAEF